MLDTNPTGFFSIVSLNVVFNMWLILTKLKYEWKYADVYIYIRARIYIFLYKLFILLLN